jgi:hypothetical protein
LGSIAWAISIPTLFHILDDAPFLSATVLSFKVSWVQWEPREGRKQRQHTVDDFDASPVLKSDLQLLMEEIKDKLIATLVLLLNFWIL